jgi:caveolin 1
MGGSRKNSESSSNPDPAPTSAAKGVQSDIVVTEQSSKSAEKKSFLSNNPISKFDYKKLKGGFTHNRIHDLDYAERDPSALHSEVKVNFFDVIAEPKGAHSFDTVWGTSFKTYSLSKYWCYRVLTAILGIPCALFWGLYFAVLAFMNIWCVVPFVKGFTIQMSFFGRVWSLVINTFLDPFFRSIGLIFNSIKIAFTMNRT